MGEGIFVSKSNLGGSSKHLVVSLVSVVQGLGLPGSCSQRNGTEAEEWSGGVCIPEGSVDCIMGGTERSGSFRMELASGSTSPVVPISLSLSLYLGAFSLWLLFGGVFLWRNLRHGGRRRKVLGRKGWPV